jgi:adenylate kinase family enzyme
MSRGGHRVLLPGLSGSGKSTLAAYLAEHGFGYLGDNCIAMATASWSLRPLSTRTRLR